MKTKKMYRQGDVFLTPCSAQDLTKAKKVPPENGRVILAHGEITGHHHSIDCNLAELYALTNGLSVLKVMHEAPLVHQEHEMIVIPMGHYNVTRQREYDPTEVRNVAD